GASGALRQEFRALELLDYITCLRYRGKLPACVGGDVRNDLIASFRAWKGEHFIPQGVHKSIRWSKSDPYIEDSIIEIDRTNLLKEREKRRKKLQKLGELQPKDAQMCGKKRYKTDDEVRPEYSQRMKKIRSSVAPENSAARQVNLPLGLRWKENSCAYDAALTILYNAWQEDPTVMTDHFAATSLDTMFKLSDGFLKVLNG
ncbi:hypothetical protein M378DRAFT_32463, partial [Amanita muscaria Koide BX008]